MHKFDETKDILRVQGVNARGFGIIPKLVMQDERLPIESKAIYAYFRSFAGAGDTAFPSINKICSDLGISDERFRRHFRPIKDCGYIAVEQQKENGKFARNIYTLIDNPTPKTPYPQFTDTENTDTPSRNINALTDVPTPKTPYPQFTGTEIPCTENPGTKNNNIKNNSKKNYQSVSQLFPDENPTDGLTNISSNNPEQKELERILKNGQVELYQARLFIESVIKRLHTDGQMPYILKMGLTHKEIKNRLRLLTLKHIDVALSKMSNVRSNKELYFAKCLLTAIVEVDLAEVLDDAAATNESEIAQHTPATQKPIQNNFGQREEDTDEGLEGLYANLERYDIPEEAVKRAPVCKEEESELPVCERYANPFLDVPEQVRMSAHPLPLAASITLPLHTGGASEQEDTDVKISVQGNATKCV